MRITSPFKKTPGPLAGIDIGASAIKLVQLARDRGSGTYTVARCAWVPTPRAAIKDGAIVDVDAVAAAIQRLLRSSRSNVKRAAFAIPAAAVIRRELVLPADLSEREMELQVEFEANQYVPFAADEVNLDFCVLGPNKSSAEDVDVLLVASRRERVEDLQAVAEAAGVTLEVVDVDALAAQRALTHLDGAPTAGEEGPAVALLDMKAGSSMLRVLRGDKLLHERELLIGGHGLTQEVARHYGLTEEEAETRKCQGDLPEDYAAAVLAPFLARAAQEVSNAIQLFFTRTSYRTIDKIWLAGGGALPEGLAGAVQGASGFPCQLVYPFAGMPVEDDLADGAFARQAPRYLTACGLALRRFSA